VRACVCACVHACACVRIQRMHVCVLVYVVDCHRRRINSSKHEDKRRYFKMSPLCGRYATVSIKLPNSAMVGASSPLVLFTHRFTSTIVGSITRSNVSFIKRRWRINNVIYGRYTRTRPAVKYSYQWPQHVRSRKKTSNSFT